MSLSLIPRPSLAPVFDCCSHRLKNWNQGMPGSKARQVEAAEQSATSVASYRGSFPLNCMQERDLATVSKGALQDSFPR